MALAKFDPIDRRPSPAWKRDRRARASQTAAFNFNGVRTMTFDAFSRRRVLQGSAALAVAGAFSTRPAFAKDAMVGFVYVGSRDDYGYNQAHAAGAAALKKMPGLKVVEEEKGPETQPAGKTKGA